jgi:protoheme IX farnesyltransferase
MNLHVSSYIQLTKPRIVVLVLVTALAALVVQGSLLSRPGQLLIVLFAITLVAGSANAFNQYFERDLDAMMARSRDRRPLPLRQVAPRNALVFAIAIGVLSVGVLYFRATPLSAWLALGTIVFYGFFYTLWLKPHTVHNIVIGGAAGAMGPVIAWAAATGSLAIAPILMFLIIFLWTPPHFWALALCVKEDYRAVGIPMLPIVKGDEETYRQIEIYSAALVALTLSMPFLRTGGLLYALLALGLGVVFLWKAILARRAGTVKAAWGVFGYSIVYLFALFLGLIADAIWRIPVF